MTSIRPLQRQDIPQVASLYESVMRSGSRTPAPQLGAYFERTLLDHPWADAEVPSLVYETTDGGIAGFLGSHARRLRFDGQPIRAGYSGQLISAPAVRNKGIGALLLRRYLAGPQQVTLTDGATTEVRRMWERLGGNTVYLSSLGWTRFFRPFRAGGDRLLTRLGRSTWTPYLRPIWSLPDAVAVRVGESLFGAHEPVTQAEPLTSRDVLEHLPAIADRLRLRPDYDEPFLDWLFDEMPRSSVRGDLVRQLVRERGGRVLGWYIAYIPPGGIAEVQQIAAKESDVPALLQHLLHHAWQSGAVILRGRLEPQLFDPIREGRFYLHNEAGVLVHSRDMSIINAILRGDALLTRMDGEWWMGHHIEVFA